MHTAADVIAKFGGTIAAAEALGAPPSTVSSWKTRNSIPSAFWPKIVSASDGAITYETLGRIKADSLNESGRTPPQTIEAAE